jgi:hypothetical protein
MPRKQTRNTHWARQSATQRGYRSGLEATTADYLKKRKVAFGFETEKIKYTKPETNHTYTPDFVLTKKDGTVMYVETKGRFLYDDASKHLLIKEQHPELDIRFVFSSLNAKVGQSKRVTCAMWAEKHGYKYSHKTIPESWLKE